MPETKKTRRDPSRKPTLRDIAKLAGVGTATVERVLNERGMVAPRTAERVIRAAKTLGVRRLLPRVYRTPIRIEVLLPGYPSLFHRRLDSGFVRGGGMLGTDVIVHRTFIGEEEPIRLTKHILATASRRKGLIVYAPDVPEVEAALEQSVSRGVPVLTVVTKVEATGLIHVGIDQAAAGRTAAYFIGGFAKNPGSVVIVTGRQNVRAHSDRITAFRDTLSEHFPGLEIDIVIEGWDDLDRTDRFLREYLHRKPAPVAIYDTTWGNRAGGRVLKEFGLAGKVVFVGHEITRSTVELLRERIMTVVIDQNPELHASRALQVLLHELGYSDATPPSPSIPFSIVTPENLELYIQMPAFQELLRAAQNRDTGAAT